MPHALQQIPTVILKSTSMYEKNVIFCQNNGYLCKISCK